MDFNKEVKKTTKNFKKNLKEKGVLSFAWSSFKVYVAYKVVKKVFFK